jgi:hypothetical protein
MRTTIDMADASEPTEGAPMIDKLRESDTY